MIWPVKSEIFLWLLIFYALDILESVTKRKKKQDSGLRNKKVKELDEEKFSTYARITIFPLKKIVKTAVNDLKEINVPNTSRWAVLALLS